jgi:hypothetical protein
MAKSLAGGKSIRNWDLDVLIEQSAWDIVNTLEISPRQLQRDCKKLFGKTPTRCIRDLRCALAVKGKAGGQMTKGDRVQPEIRRRVTSMSSDQGGVCAVAERACEGKRDA